VSVLEVVDANVPDDTIEQVESYWKTKLLSRTFGLNRAAVARLRTSRRLAGCLETEPINGLFDQTTGVNFQRRRRRS
jgi:hypothetical protein